MDKFVTVTKTSRAPATTIELDKGRRSRTKHRFNPYNAAQSEERSFEQWRASKREKMDNASSHDDEGVRQSKPSAAELTRRLLNTLSEESNPITHSDSVRRADHVVSVATGHQRSELRPSRQQYFSLRNKKIEEQTAAKETKVLSGIRVYINGYLRDTTDIEMKRIIAQAGGQVQQVAAGATHILTSQQLNAFKTHKLLTTKSKVKTHVVRPEWIMDCIEVGKRLPERTYSVIADATTRNLADMFGAGSSSGTGSKEQETL